MANELTINGQVVTSEQLAVVQAAFRQAGGVPTGEILPNSPANTRVAALEAGVGVTQRRERLNRLMSSAMLFNASDAPDMTSPPTITGVASPVNAVTLRVNVADQAVLFSMYDGKPNLVSGYWQAVSVTRPSGQEGNSFRIRFWYDDTNLDILQLGSTNGRVRVLVGGQYASRTGTNTLTNTGPNYINVNFGSRARRLIDLEFDRGSAFGGINIPQSATVQPVSAADKYTIVLFTDSIGQSTGVDRAGDGFAYHAARRLGNMNVDMRTAGIGSTGYKEAGTSPGVTTWAFTSHLDDVLLTTADEVWVAGGINDTSSDLPGLQAAALATWQGLRQRVGTTVPIIVWGVFAGPPAYSAGSTKEAALKVAFDQWADPYSAFVPFRGVRPIQTGGSLDATGTGSITGTALTLAASGTWAQGMVLMGKDVLPETYLQSGSGTSWTVSKPQTVSSQTLGGSNPVNGNFGHWGGGLTGQDPIHPGKTGMDMIGSWVAAARRSLSI